MKLAGDQKSSLQSGASKRKGRMRVSRRTQFSTAEERHAVNCLMAWTLSKLPHPQIGTASFPDWYLLIPKLHIPRLA